MAAEKKLEQVDYYELLGVEKTASTGEIEDRYYSLASRFHPDRFATSGNSEGLAALTRIYARVGEAKNILMDAIARRDYDRGLTVGVIRIREVTPKTRAISQEDPSNPTAQSLLAKAIASESAGDLKSAMANLKLALQFEASSPALQLRLESVRSKLGRGEVMAAKRASAKLMAAKLLALGRPKPTSEAAQANQESKPVAKRPSESGLTAQRSAPDALTLSKEAVQRTEPDALTFPDEEPGEAWIQRSEPIGLTLPDEEAVPRMEPIGLTLPEAAPPIVPRMEPIALTLPEAAPPIVPRTEPIALTLPEAAPPTVPRTEPIGLTLPKEAAPPIVPRSESIALTLLKENAPTTPRTEPIALTLPTEVDRPTVPRTEPIALTLQKEDAPTTPRSAPTLLQEDAPAVERSAPIGLTLPEEKIGDSAITFLAKEAGKPTLPEGHLPDRVQTNSLPVDQETAEEESYDSYDFELPDSESGILEISEELSDSAPVEAGTPEPQVALRASDAPFSLGELVGEYLRLRPLPARSILGVDAKASTVQTRAAYETLVRLYHPHNNDAAGDDERMRVCRDLVGIVVKAYKEI